MSGEAWISTYFQYKSLFLPTPLLSIVILAIFLELLQLAAFPAIIWRNLDLKIKCWFLLNHLACVNLTGKSWCKNVAFMTKYCITHSATFLGKLLLMKVGGTVLKHLNLIICFPLDFVYCVSCHCHFGVYCFL